MRFNKWATAGAIAGLVPVACLGIYLRYMMALHGEPSSVWLFQSLGLLK